MRSPRLGVGIKRTMFLACAGGLASVAMACSAGGAPSQPTQAPAAAGAAAPQTASTPRLKIAMITHQAPGDTFWDIVRKGADAAAAKDNVALEARCAGVKSGLSSGQTENLYVTGTNMPSVRSTIAAKLQSDSSIDSVITLGAPFALTAVTSAKDASSKAKIYTFDTNAELVNAIKSGDVQWAIDQQPYLQGYLAVDSLWLYLNNGDIIGGGKTVLTGPSFITKDNIEAIAQYAS